MEEFKLRFSGRGGGRRSRQGICIQLKQGQDVEHGLFDEVSKTMRVRLRTRVLAGDVEVNEVFSQDDVGHTISIICHLTHKERKHNQRVGKDYTAAQR